MRFPIRVAVRARCLQDAAEPAALLCPGAAGGTGTTAAPTPNLARAGFQGQEGQGGTRLCPQPSRGKPAQLLFLAASRRVGTITTKPHFNGCLTLLEASPGHVTCQH